MADGLFGGAAFGVYPQLQPRRRFQDPEGAANLPADVLRGRIAGLFGLVPDVLNFMGRSPMPTEMFGETQYEPTPQLPYGSEYYLKNLPLAPTSRAGEIAGQAGAFVPLNPMPAARAVAAGARALGPTAARMTEGYLQRQGFMPGVVEGESAGMLGGAIKPQAPVSELGFYSAAEQAAMNLQRGKGTGQSFLNDLMKGQDVKKDELSWLGLDDYLKDKPNVTRQEVQDFIASNRVDVRERQLGGVLSPEMQTTRDALHNNYRGLVDNIADAKSQFEEGKISYAQLRNTVSNNQVQIQALDAQINEINKTIPSTKYQNYQLPGGENYREILLTLPARMDTAGWSAQKSGSGWLVFDETGAQRGSNYTATTANNAIAEMASERAGKSYTSSHFDEPNILAHMRVNDRVDADGKKMLLIEEIQSDWHQAGREKGYIGNYAKGDVKPYTPERAKAEFGLPNNDLFWYFEVPDNTLQIPKSRFGTQDEAMNYVLTEKKVNSEGVPDAPFKDTWHQLALKRALKYAADNGYDRVGLTTGRQQIDRYTNELRQNVDELQFFPIGNQNNILISAKKGGKQTFSGTVADGKFIDGPAEGKTVTEVLGKSMAKQIAEKKDGVIKGDDLTIGGEGMKAYYDEIYPAFLNKQGKKYGAQVGETTIKTGNAYAQTKGIPAEQSVRYLDITPEIRNSVKKGQPLFAAAPIGALTASEFDYTDPFPNTIADTTR